MNRRVLVPLGFAAALAGSLFLDGWAYRSLVGPGAYDHDWGRLLRIGGSLVLWAPLALAVWLERRRADPSRGWQAWLLLLGPALAGGVAEVIKILVRRERPALHAGEYVFRAFADRPFDTRDLGFPSSHTMVAFGGAAILARLFPRAAPLGWLLAAGCGLTRVLVHAHFLSDVAGGAMAGWATGALLWHLVTRTSRVREAPRATS